MAVGASVPLTAGAQYFGRNKVQYETFDFKVLQTEHFDIYFYPAERDAAVLVGRMAERWYARFTRLLDHELNRRQPLILYASHPHFEQTNAILGEIGESTGGVTELFKRRIVLPLAGPLEDTDHVLGHELAHAFQFDITGDPGRVSASNAPVAIRLPLWFIEGMAEYLSIGPVDAHTAMWMRDAARVGELPSIGKLDNPKYFPYRWGQSVWAYIGGRFGDEAVGRILKASRRTRDAAIAIERVTGIPLDSLSKDWQAALRGAYEPLAAHTDTSVTGAAPLLNKKISGGELNVAPAISPDGEKVAFLSERDLFAIDVFIADATTGKVQGKLTETAVSAHFESLQFINSAGAWASDGRRFVVGAISKGDPVLSIFDVESGALEREVRLRGLDEVLNPTWSPDGQAVAFSANSGGLSDLFLYDFVADTLRRLTSDPYSDIQPAWSPDGRSIAFVTDRFGSDLGTLRIGPYRLALIDPRTGTIRAVRAFDRGKHINPQWSSDSRSLYFLSDRTGITNVYRLELASGELRQVTDLYTGVSGITDLSPALSVAAQANRMAYTVYERGDYNVYQVDDLDVLAGRPVADLTAVNGDPAMLPPSTREQAQVVAMLENPIYGLPNAEEFTDRDYRPGLSLDYVSDPYLAFGSDRFGTFIGAGASLFWSDMLGSHNVVTGFQVNGSFRDIAALAAYSNLTRRLNWGAAVQQIPFVFGGLGVSFDPVTGIFIEQVERFRQVNRDATVFAAYPFNRVRRLEFSGGYRNVTFDWDIQTVITDASGQSTRERFEFPSCDVSAPPCVPEGMHLGTASAALVYDNAIFGWTGPILGQRYRIEVSPTVGTLSNVNLLGDYRRYAMPVRPFTLAGRIMHFGRYGAGADDRRLSPLFLGYPQIIRGYDFNSFSGNECVGATEANPCPALFQLYGSKMAVANLEVRFPPLGALGLGPGLFGILPIDMVGFYDAGVAWSDSSTATKAWFLGGDRNLVSSAGVGLRFNLLGFAIAEIDRVYPFDRPNKGWYWQFAFTQAF